MRFKVLGRFLSISPQSFVCVCMYLHQEEDSISLPFNLPYLFWVIIKSKGILSLNATAQEKIVRALQGVCTR